MDEPSEDGLVPLLWVCGTSGVGKSTVGWELFRRGLADGAATAYVDIDQLGMLYPPPAGDEERDGIKAHNLSAVVATFLAAGAERLIVSGVVDPAAAPSYANALAGVRLTWCQLDLANETLHDRLILRGWSAELIGHCLEYARSLTTSGFAHVAIDTTGLAVPEVVRQISEVQVTPEIGVPCTRGIPNVTGSSKVPAVLLITGGRAVGKSTIGYEVFRRTHAAGTRSAFIDLKQLGFFSEAQEGAAVSEAVKTENAVALVRNFSAAGASRVVLGGEVASVAELARALEPAELTTYVLTASAARLRERARSRAAGDGPRLVGDDLPPTDELTPREMTLNAYPGAATVDTTDMTVDEVVSHVIRNTKAWST